MAEISKKTRSGKTISVDPGEYDSPVAAAQALEHKVTAAGGAALTRREKRYTRREVVPSKAVMLAQLPKMMRAQLPQHTPPAIIIEEPRCIAWYLEQERAERQRFADASAEFRDVRWFFYTLIEASKLGEQSMREGGPPLLTFGRFGMGQRLLVDPGQQAIAAHGG